MAKSKENKQNWTRPENFNKLISVRETGASLCPLLNLRFPHHFLSLLTTHEATRIQSFFILDIRFRFTCDELSLHGNIVNDKDIVSLIVNETLYIQVSHQKSKIERGRFNYELRYFRNIVNATNKPTRD